MIKYSILIFSVILYAGCTKIGANQSSSNHHAATPYTMPAAAYLAIAKNQVGEEQQNMLLMAAGRSLYDGDWQQANAILSQAKPMSAMRQSEKNILLAKIDMQREKPKEAIAKLSAVGDRSRLSMFYQAQYHEILASAYETIGNISYAVPARIKLEHLLGDEPSRIHNRRILWLTLTRLPTAELNTMIVEADADPELQGWLRLAVIPKQNQESQKTLLAQVEQWQSDFPQHPANSILPSPLSAAVPFLHRSSPRKMALLLPMTGPFAGPGAAIKDGFVAAYNADSPSHQIDVRLYDTASEDVRSLYQQAIKEGAEYIVGPLAKNDVAKIATMEHPVTTLLLNDADVATSDNAYRFGLSPSNEARQVAVKASKKGLKRALIIAPAGAWGDEIVAAFYEQWRMNGGHVVERLAYDDHTNLNSAVRDFLHSSDSQARKKQYRSEEGAEGYSPKRRQDFDMIFLLAYPSKARQIMPLLKYYFAGNVPVYATSAVYGGSTNTLRDRDLEGIIFCDMPWVFNHQLPSKNWPEQLNSYSRLYALGMDSYALASQLNQLILFPATGISDKSGVLYLNRAQQVARVLAWGRFKGGVAELTSETT